MFEAWLEEEEVEYEVWLDGNMICAGVADDEMQAYTEANDFIYDDCEGTSYEPEDYEVKIL